MAKQKWKREEKVRKEWYMHNVLIGYCTMFSVDFLHATQYYNKNGIPLRMKAWQKRPRGAVYHESMA